MSDKRFQFTFTLSHEQADTLFDLIHEEICTIQDHRLESYPCRETAEWCNGRIKYMEEMREIIKAGMRPEEGEEVSDES